MSARPAVAIGGGTGLPLVLRYRASAPEAALGGPIAMAYIERALAEPGTRLLAGAQDKPLPVVVTTMPFTPRRYYRG